MTFDVLIYLMLLCCAGKMSRLLVQDEFFHVHYLSSIDLMCLFGWLQDLRVQNNTSPLDSGGSNAESDSAFSSISTMSSHETSRNRNLESGKYITDLNWRTHNYRWIFSKIWHVSAYFFCCKDLFLNVIVYRVETLTAYNCHFLFYTFYENI